jgi:hypothetical protein
MAERSKNWDWGRMSDDKKVKLSHYSNYSNEVIISANAAQFANRNEGQSLTKAIQFSVARLTKRNYFLVICVAKYGRLAKKAHSTP